MSDSNRLLSAEFRAKLIADSMGMLPPGDRWNAVYRTALEQIRTAQAVAANLAVQGRRLTSVD